MYNSDHKVLHVILWCAFLFIIAWAFSSCTTQRKVEKWNARNATKAAAYCAKTFPPIEWVEVRHDTLTDTTIAFSPDYVFDTLYVGPDTVVMKAKCPPSKVITRTIRDSVKVRVRDSAAVFEAKKTLLEAKEQLIKNGELINELHKKVKERNTELWWHRLLIVALLLWIFRKPILRLINPIKL